MTKPSVDRDAVEQLAFRSQWLHHGARFGLPLPDVLLAILFAAAAAIEFVPMAWVAWLPTRVFAARQDMVFGLFVEGGFLMFQGTIVDIATRLRTRPPVWAVPIIFGGVLLFSDHARGVLQIAWQQGAVVFVPLVISLFERSSVLWQMPQSQRIAKIAARALIANRITTGLALLACVAATMICGIIFRDAYERLNGYSPALFAGSIYFAVAAYDGWRVRGRTFAEHPAVLFRFDPIQIDYLAPL
jgi:hypothetical protein